MAIIVGLTGGIGSGKSTILDFIQSKGYHVYNTDKAGKLILEKKDVINKIINIFGIDIVDNNDNIDTKKLASIVFKDKNKLAQLNDIIHPEVAKDFSDKVQSLKDNELIIKESAILFESGSHENCDYTILITAPKEIKIDRAMKRDHISREKVLERMRNQWSDEKKSKMADFIVENIDQNKAFEEVEKTLKQIIVLGKK